MVLASRSPLQEQLMLAWETFITVHTFGRIKMRYYNFSRNKPHDDQTLQDAQFQVISF